MRKLNEECGVFGIIDNTEQPAVQITATALMALQHRGQEGTGIAYFGSDGLLEDNIFCKKDIGLVTDVFDRSFLSEEHSTKIACGHVRYSGGSANTAENTQPIVTNHPKLTFALCANCSITNAAAIRNKMVNELGMVFYTTNDSEIISKLIIRNMLKTGDIIQAISSVMDILQGAYSVLIMTKDRLILARDPHGFRPLCIGKADSSYVAASETCALDSIGAQLIRDVKPGEIVVISGDGIQQTYQHKPYKRALCVFELVYFARPDSYIDGMSVYKARFQMGEALARQCPTEADIVCGVPDSGYDAAYGYSHQSEIPYGMAFVKNRYVGRSFILPSQVYRARAVGLKLNALKASVEGKRIILVDDSIVRGTTCAKIIKRLREAGAKEIHLRISSPPFIAPCYFGTDIDSKDKLIANHLTHDEICKQVGADSLVFLDLNELNNIKQGTDVEYCLGCFTDQYPVEIADENAKVDLD